MPKLLESPEEIDALLASVRSIVVLGAKPESRAFEPAHYVPRAAQRAGYRIVPVPVRYPEVTAILGEPVVRELSAVPRPVELVDVFRRPVDLPAHLDDLRALQPRAVWLQSGIVHDGVARALIDAGVDVVMDRCLMVELSRRARG